MEPTGGAAMGAQEREEEERGNTGQGGKVEGESRAGPEYGRVEIRDRREEIEVRR